jgi:hypothetical protein
VDIIGWVWWLLSSLLGLVWTVAWFLLGGWVSTLAQIAVVVLIIFGYKFGWRRAPYEIWSRVGGFARFAWNWIRQREQAQAAPAAARVETREVIRTVRFKERGDINLSTLLSLLTLLGLLLLGSI